MCDVGDAIRELSFHGPGGHMGAIEGLAAALGGKSQSGSPHPVGQALDNIAEANHEIATAINRLADVVERALTDR
jgi:hypothetical protein